MGWVGEWRRSQGSKADQNEVEVDRAEGGAACAGGAKVVGAGLRKLSGPFSFKGTNQGHRGLVQAAQERPSSFSAHPPWGGSYRLRTTRLVV